MSPTMFGNREVSRMQIYDDYFNNYHSKLARIQFNSQNIIPSSMISHHMGTFRNSWKFEISRRADWLSRVPHGTSE